MSGLTERAPQERERSFENGTGNEVASFRAWFTDLPVAAFACDRSGLIVWFNQSARRLWGRVPQLRHEDDRFCGSFRLLTPDGTEIPRAECAMAEALRTGQSQQAAVVFERPDGTRVTTQANVRPLRDDNGDICGAASVLVEISPEASAEQALNALEARYRSLLETVSEALLLTDQDGLISYASPSVERQHGGGGDRLAGRSVFEFVHPDDRVAARAAYAQALENPGEQIPYLVRLRRQDGCVRWLDGVCVNQLQNPELRGVILGFRDVTEHRRDQEEIRRSHQELKAFFSQSIDGCFVMMLDEPLSLEGDRDPGEVVATALRTARLATVNDALLRQYEAQRDELIGLTPLEFHRHEPALARRLWRELFRSGSIRVDSAIRTASGRVVRIEGEYIAIYDGAGRLTGHFGIQRDVTRRIAAEEARSSSEAALKLALAAGRMAEWHWDAEPDRVTVCADCRALYGIPDGLPLDLATFVGRIHPADREHTRTVLQRTMTERSGCELEHRVIRDDGSERWISLRCQVGGRSSDTALRMDGVAFDVTDRRLSEEALRDSEARYRAIVEYTPSLICRYQPDGTLTFVNNAFCRYFGLSRDTLLGGSFPFGLHPGEDPVLSRLQDPPIPGMPPCSREQRVISEDGDVRWIQWTNSPVHDEAGRLIECQAIGHDVTDRRMSEQALREHQQRLRMMVEQLPAILWTTDRNLVVTSSTGAAMMQLGLRPGQLENTCLIDYFGNPDDDFLPLAAHRRALTGESVLYEMPWQSRYFQTRIDPLLDDRGDVTGTIGLAVDITERKCAEDERQRLEARMQHSQKLESLGVLAGGIAHDFNNLLTSMLGYAGLARLQLSADSPALPPLSEIERAAQRAAELTEQMLSYSGRGRFVVESVQLDELIREMIQLLRTVVASNADFRTDLLPAVIEADATQIRQVAMNLITNASDALNGEPGEITVRTGTVQATPELLRSPDCPEELPAGRYAFIEVGDSGCGMDDNTRRRLFDPFFTTKFTGRGLGLAAVLGIVRSHSGTIHVDSRQGAGTTFRVLLPAASGSEPADAHAERSLPQHSCDGTVLIIEDDPTVRGFIRRVLEFAGCSVLAAAGGREGVALFRDHDREIRVVLLDLTMPGMNGPEVIRRLRELRASVPIVVMSGYSGEDALPRLQGDRISAFLHKPFQPHELLDQVRTAMTGPDRPTP